MDRQQALKQSVGGVESVLCLMIAMILLAFGVLWGGCSKDTDSDQVGDGTDTDSETNHETESDTNADVNTDPDTASENVDALSQYQKSYCEPLAQLFCEQARVCGCDLIPGWPEDPHGCRDFVRDKCVSGIDGFKDALSEGELVVVEDAPAACLDAIEVATGPCELTPEYAIGSVCLLMISSEEKIGKSCTFPVCAHGKGSCDKNGICQPIPTLEESCTGVCEVPFVCRGGTCVSLGALESPCAKDEQCLAPLKCRSQKCQALSPEDGACTKEEHCQAGLTCDGIKCVSTADPCTGPEDDCGHMGACLGSTAKVCLPQSALGEPCDSHTACGEAAWCDRDGSGKCEILPSVGEDCADGVYCGEGLGCRFPDGPCEALPGKGAPCALGVLGPFLCADGLGCVGMICADLPGKGEECAIDNRCAGDLGCDFTTKGSICTPRSPTNGPCTNDTMCGQGDYCSFRTLVCTPHVEEGGECRDGNECGPGRTCLPTGPGKAICVATPGQGEACFFECAEGLTCSLENREGRCAPPICGILAG